MDNLIFLFSLFLAFELFESNWQKSDSLYGVVSNNYNIYKKSMLLFFVMNPSFIFSLYLAIGLYDFGFWMSFIVILKFADIATRLMMFKKIDNDEDISSILPVDIPMNIYLRYLNLAIYLPALFIVFFVK